MVQPLVIDVSFIGSIIQQIFHGSLNQQWLAGLCSSHPSVQERTLRAPETIKDNSKTGKWLASWENKLECMCT
jgi:hypothetical protein